MKNYHIYVFSQDNCAPCKALKDYVHTLTDAEQGELDFVPIRTATGNRTALADELHVELTPTMVVVHEDHDKDLSCDDYDEFVEYHETPVETVVGARAIMQTLSATLDAYTYAHPPE